MKTAPSGLERFFRLVEESFQSQNLVKLTLGKPCGPDASLKNIFLRPVQLRGEWQLSFTHRHETKDITKNHRPDEALALLREWVPSHFLDAHVFTPAQVGQLSCRDDGTSHFKVKLAQVAPPAALAGHDRPKQRAISETAPWLADLNVTTFAGKVREDMTAKFRQINRFVEIVAPLLKEAGLEQRKSPFRVVDMGCGKGYLTFALAHHLGAAARILGIEARPALVETCNRIAKKHGLEQLSFEAGHIVDTQVEQLDVLIALHACDTATDDALAAGLRAHATVLVVSPCCQKELRPQLEPAPALAPALRHGIFAERHAEFVTDALRALLLEASGYRTQVFEFITTEHTAKNTMISAVRLPQPDRARSERALAAARDLAALYGIRSQRLATHLGLALV